MSSIFFLLMLLCLCSCKYISKSDMDLGRFQTYLKGSSPYSRNIVREALYKSIRDSLQKLSDRVGEHIFGNEETRELYAYKVAKEYILSTEKENFNQDDIQKYIINAEDKIAENIDKLKTTVVEGTLKIAIEEDLLESWQKNETYQEKMRNEPYTYYIDNI